MWPFREHTAIGNITQPTNSHLDVIEKTLAKMGLVRGGNWIPSLDHLTVNAPFQRPGHASVYRAEAFTDAGGTHCRLTCEMGYILLSPAGNVTACSIAERSPTKAPAANESKIEGSQRFDA